ncbi:MAG: pyridoxamine kinase [Acutalibacteraceae bacterium]
MNDKKVLTIQDISCYGQCSLTVALPVISACGTETAILPSAVLSTHTGGFTGYTFRDLTDDIPKIAEHWNKENISFDAIYTGYLGSKRQINSVKNIMAKLLNTGGVKIVDPAMADNGKLYTGFDAAFAKEMASLCGEADVILPNITEACLMTDYPFKAQGEYDEKYIAGLLKALAALGCNAVVLTGVTYEENSLGAAVYDCKKNETRYYFHQRIAKSFHGTGDVFASAFTGAVVKGKSYFDAAVLAADFTVESILKTADDANHRYGVKFEKALPLLVKELNK